MRHKFGKIIVIGLGGSIVFPGQIDWRFLQRFRSFIRSRISKKRFILVVGGGRLARVYQEAAGKVVSVTDEDRDWLGIHATRSNAHLLRTVFRDLADPIVIDSRNRIKKLRRPITVASGWFPGWSTDYIAIRLAADFGASEVIIAGKPAFVYPIRSGGTLRALASSNGAGDKELNKKHPFSKLTWNEYLKLIPKKWKPGLHSPVDPVAAHLAEKEKIKAIIVNGKNLKNFGILLRGKNFKGTIIG